MIFEKVNKILRNMQKKAYKYVSEKNMSKEKAPIRFKNAQKKAQRQKRDTKKAYRLNLI